MIRTDYNLPIFQDTDIADLNYYTNELASALKVQIDRFGSPLTFKGIVSTLADLDNLAAENGDIYNVTAINKNYVYNGTEWLEYSDTINNSCQELISDEYNSILTYNVGDFCIYNNQLYKCNTQITTPENWTAAHWTLTTIGDELKSLEEDSSWIIPTLSIGEQPSSNNYKCRYRKIGKIVYIKGVISNVDQTGTLFTLPTEFRPAYPERFLTNSGNNTTTSNMIRVLTNGSVELTATSNTGTYEITMDGISFVAN